MSHQFIKKFIVLFLITLASSGTAAVESTTLIPIGGLTSGMPVLSYSSEFKVPIKARKMGTCGWVDLEFNVSRKGKVKQPKVVSSSHSYFEKSAIKGIKRVFYKPAVDDQGLNTSFKAMRARVSYFLKEGCKQVFPDKASNYVATHCLKIDFNSASFYDKQIDYYVKNTCSYPVIGAACISGNTKQVGTCAYQFILEPKKRRWLKFGLRVTEKTKISKQAFACKLDKQKSIRMVDVNIHKFRGTLTATCRGAN
jgi:TonB family protein